MHPWCQHLKLNSERNHILEYANECEEESIKRVSQDILRNANIKAETKEKPKVLNRRFNATKAIEHDERYTRKIMHGFFQIKMKSGANIDFHTSLSQSKNRHTSSTFAGYINAFIGQEIPIRYLQHKRQADHGIEPTTDKCCRLCHASAEDVVHVISGCPHVSARYYLPLRQDALAKHLLTAIHVFSKEINSPLSAWMLLDILPISASNVS